MASSRLRDLHRAKLGRATGHCFLKADQATAISLLAGLGVHDPPTQRALYNFPLRSPFTLATAACDGAVQNKTAPDQCGSHRARTKSPLSQRPRSVHAHRDAAIGFNTRRPTPVNVSFGSFPEGRSAGSAGRGGRQRETLAGTRVVNSPCASSTRGPPSSLLGLGNRFEGMAERREQADEQVVRLPCSQGFLVQGSRPGSAPISVKDKESSHRSRPYSTHSQEPVQAQGQRRARRPATAAPAAGRRPELRAFTPPASSTPSPCAYGYQQRTSIAATDAHGRVAQRPRSSTIRLRVPTSPPLAAGHMPGAEQDDSRAATPFLDVSHSGPMAELSRRSWTECADSAGGVASDTAVPTTQLPSDHLSGRCEHLATGADSGSTLPDNGEVGKGEAELLPATDQAPCPSSPDHSRNLTTAVPRAPPPGQPESELAPRHWHPAPTDDGQQDVEVATASSAGRATSVSAQAQVPCCRIPSCS